MPNEKAPFILKKLVDAWANQNGQQATIEVKEVKGHDNSIKSA